MKLLVHLKTVAKNQQGALHALELAVGPQDTAKAVKERIAVVEPVPFPDQDLVLDGKVLVDDARLADFALKDGSSLDLVVKASEEVFAQQLRELLQAKPAISPEELGLLYAHRHGASAASALKVLGLKEQLRDFLGAHGCFALENGAVSWADEPEKKAADELGGIKEEDESEVVGHDGYFPVHVAVVLQTPVAPDETSHVDLNVRGTDTVLGLKERVGAAELLPFPDRKLFLGGGELVDDRRLADCGVKDGSALDFVATASEDGLAQQLEKLLQARTLPISELGLLYSSRHGTPVSRALKLLGKGEKLPGFLGRLPQFVVRGGCVRAAPKAAPGAGDSRHYLDLHEKVCGAGFSDKASAALERVAVAVLHAGCLNVRRAVRTGSVGRGTAAPGAEDAEVVLLVEALPLAGCERWLPGLLVALAATLQAQLGEADGIEEVCASADALQVRCAEGLAVRVLVAPAAGSWHEVVDALGAHAYSAVALAEQRASFVVRQSEEAKMAARLLKWWRSRQSWASPRSRPSDWLLELAVAHAAAQCESNELGEVLARAWSLLRDFGDLHLVWPAGVACYADAEVPEPVLRQRPLLMDPCNPLVNVADPEAFDPAELMALARSSPGLA